MSQKTTRSIHHPAAPEPPVRSRLHVSVLLLFTLLTLALSWPLLLRIFQWIPGVPQWAFDESTFVWNIWYFKHALIDNLHTPLHTDLIYYPLGIDLVLYTYNFFNALIAQPLLAAVNLPFASNSALLFSTVLSGYGTFLLVRYLLNREMGQSYTLPALAAGLLYAFASNRAVYATLGHYDMVTTQWIPFYALMLLRSLDGALGPARRRKAAALAGLFFAFNGLAEMITAVFLALFSVIVVLIQLWQIAGGRGQCQAANSPQPTASGRRRRTTHYLRNVLAPGLGITGTVAFLLWSPVLVPILTQFLTNDFSLKGWGEAIDLSTDLFGWFTPTVLHPLWGGDLVATLRQILLRKLEPANVAGIFRDVNTVFIGWTSAALALLGAFRYRRRVAIWIWTLLIFAVFTLGPFLQINGQYRFDLDGVETAFPLPYALLHYIPIVKSNRAPNRNSVLLMLGLAVLAGYGLLWIMQKVSKKRGHRGRGQKKAPSPGQPMANRQSLVAGLFIVAILFEHLALPLSLSNAQVPAVYTQIAADPRPVSVMHAPLGWRNSFGTFGAERTRLQYYQSVHQKPMLGGNISRAPDFKMDYFERIPLFQAIRDVEYNGTVDAALATAAANQAAQLMYLYNVGYVLLMPPIPQRFPYADHWPATWNFYKETLPLEPEPFWTGQGIEAYRVVQPAGRDRFQLQLGEAGTYPYRTEGWDTAAVDTLYGRPGIWATARESCLLLPLREVDRRGNYQVSVQVRPFDYPGSEPQRLAMTVNGIRLDEQSLVDDWQMVTWKVPGSTLRDTINHVCLQWAATAVPRQVLGGDRVIGTTGVSLPLDVALKSFAGGAFIALFDEETGTQIDGSAGRRGVNVTVLDPHSGEIVAMRGFDTAANQFESAKLADFLSGIQAGYPVLVATRGEAGTFLTAEAVDGLRRLGVDLRLEELQGKVFAIAGVQGAKPGTAMAVVGEEEAFLRIGLNSDDRRSLAAAVGTVTIVPQ